MRPVIELYLWVANLVLPDSVDTPNVISYQLLSHWSWDIIKKAIVDPSEMVELSTETQSQVSTRPSGPPCNVHCLLKANAGVQAGPLQSLGEFVVQRCPAEKVVDLFSCEVSVFCVQQFHTRCIIATV